jgi:hypothetical protein
LGYLIGGAYDGTLLPMTAGFAVLTAASSLLTAIVEAPREAAKKKRWRKNTRG